MASVLIVDDQADIRKVMARIVRLAGHDPVQAADGGAALQYLGGGHRPDLILLDVMMPEVDGFDVLRAVRREPRTADVPVVMFSAVSASDYVQRARDEGATDYWVKGSLGADVIVNRISSYLDGTASAVGQA